RQLPLGGDHTVDPGVELLGQPGGLDHGGTVGGCGDDRGGQPGLADRGQVAHAAREGVHTVGGQDALHIGVLPVPDPADGVRLRRIVGTALFSFDAARGEEGAHTVVAAAAVHVRGVVGA